MKNHNSPQTPKIAFFHNELAQPSLDFSLLSKSPQRKITQPKRIEAQNHRPFPLFVCLAQSPPKFQARKLVANVETRPDRRQRPLPLPAARCSTRPQPHRSRRRHQGRDRPRNQRHAPPPIPTSTSTGSPSANSPASSKPSRPKASPAPSWPARSSTSRSSPASAPTGASPSSSSTSAPATPTCSSAPVAKVLSDEGIELISSTQYLEPLLAKPGVLTSRAPDEEEGKDIAYGRTVAQAIAAYDLGQTVVIAAQACVAVEAMEGTDATIARAGALFRTLDFAGEAFPGEATRKTTTLRRSPHRRQSSQTQSGHALRRPCHRRRHHPRHAVRRRNLSLHRSREDRSSFDPARHHRSR